MAEVPADQPLEVRVRTDPSTFLLLATRRRGLAEVAEHVLLTGDVERAATFVQATSFSVSRSARRERGPMPITHHPRGRWRAVALLVTLVAVLQHAPADAAHHPPVAPAAELATSFTGPGSCASSGFLSGDTVGDANPAELYARLCGRVADQAGTDAQD